MEDWSWGGRAGLVDGERRGGAVVGTWTRGVEEWGRRGAEVGEGAGSVGRVGSGGGCVGGWSGGEHSASVRRIGQLLDNWTHQQGLLVRRSQGKRLLNCRSNDKRLLG